LAPHALIRLKRCGAGLAALRIVAVAQSPISGRAPPVLSSEISASVVVPQLLAIAPVMVDGRGVQSPQQPAIETFGQRQALQPDPTRRRLKLDLFPLPRYWT
jgi:hypothetical protein